MDASYYGPWTTGADVAMIAHHEDSQLAMIEDGTASLAEVCSYFGLAEWRIHKMIASLNVHDEIDISAAIYAGINRIAPSLNDCAQYFIAAVYVPAH